MRNSRGNLALRCLLARAAAKRKQKTAEARKRPRRCRWKTRGAGAIDHIVTADAVLYPINQANVTSKISAPREARLVNRGDHVRAGQLLAELETAIWRPLRQ